MHVKGMLLKPTSQSNLSHTFFTSLIFDAEIQGQYTPEPWPIVPLLMGPTPRGGGGTQILVLYTCTTREMQKSCYLRLKAIHAK